MKLKYLRFTDRFLGVCACFLLAALSPPFRLRPGAAKPFARILVIKFWGFGSIVLAFDAFRRLRREFPSAHICALTLEQNRDVFGLCGVFDEIVTVDLGSPRRFAVTLAKALGRIRSRRFQAAIDLEFTARFSALCSFFSGARLRAGFVYPGIWRGNFFTHTLRFQESRKLKDSIEALLTEIGVPGGKESRVCVKAADADVRRVEAMLEETGAGGSLLVGMNVNASELCLQRRWPAEYFRELAAGLVGAYGCHIVLIGAAADAPYVSAVAAKAGLPSHLHDLSGRTSIPLLAALFGRLALFISNDSGPLHLAVECGVPTVSFFGPETPAIYGPEGGAHAVFYRRLSCSPCIRVQNYKHVVCAREQECLYGITPQEVLEKIHQMGVLRKREVTKEGITGGLK